MLTIKTSTYSTHILQLVLAVIVLGLSICTLLNNKSLSSISKIYSDFIERNNGTDLSLSNNWKVNASSVASSVFTLVSSMVNFFFPTVAIKYFHPHSAITFEYYGQKTAKYLEIPIEKFVKASMFGLSKVATSYFTSLLGSEGISNIFWFVNTIVSVGNFAKTDCNSVPSLLKEYNVTGVSSTTALINFFNIFDNSSETTDLFEDIYSALSNSNVTLNEFNGIAFSNLNGSTLQSDLLLKMSTDCSIKKASMAMTIIMWIFHIISSSLVATEVFQFYIKIRNIQVQISKEKINASNTTDNTVPGSVNNEENNSVDIDDDTLVSETKVFLVFDHRWGLFNPILKRVSENETKI